MSCNKPMTNKDKWIISIISALLFVILSCPYSFQLSSKICHTVGLNGAPTILGVILHGIIFLLIIRLLIR